MSILLEHQLTDNQTVFFKTHKNCIGLKNGGPRKSHSDFRLQLKLFNLAQN